MPFTAPVGMALPTSNAMQSSTRTPHEEIAKDPYLEAMHANAEIFDLQTERLFRYLQVHSALAPPVDTWYSAI